MVLRYYIDTNVWMDLVGERFGYSNEPLGEFALKLLYQIRRSNSKIVVSDVLIKELEGNFSLDEINGLFKAFEDFVEKVFSTVEQQTEAIKLSKERDIPISDVLHAIIARDFNLLLISRDNHFKRLADISIYYKPEDII